MSSYFEIIVDSASNLTKELLNKYNITMIPYHALVNGKDFLCYDPDRDFDKTGQDFYEKMRQGADIRTSLINPATFEAVMRPYLEAERDIMLITISSGLSGSYQAAKLAANILSEEFPYRKIIVIDSLGASLGEGLMAIKMSELRNENASIETAAAFYEAHKNNMQHLFTVGDLKYLKRSGRITVAEAAVGNILSIKPILKASADGRIVMYEKVRSRKRAIAELVRLTKEKISDASNQIIAIAHCDAPEESEELARQLKSEVGVKDVIVTYYDLCTGTHVGPGTIATFFMGETRLPA